MKATSSDFDKVADLYDSSLPPIPEEYCQLVQRRFNINKKDRIIDLGCGTGLLTFVLSRFSDYVEGIDISKKMIEIARERDTERRIRWICGSVENFDFGQDRYSLIISFESFHLFRNVDELIEKCARGLRANGFLCTGWCCFQWEEQLKEIIIDVFRSNDVELEEWGYWSCRDFPAAVNRNKHLSPVIQETIRVQAKSHIHTIASYLVSIQKVAKLEINARMNLMQELRKNFRKFLSSEWISGIASYSLAYSSKRALKEHNDKSS